MINKIYSDSAGVGLINHPVQFGSISEYIVNIVNPKKPAIVYLFIDMTHVFSVNQWNSRFAMNVQSQVLKTDNQLAYKLTYRVALAIGNWQ